MVLREYLLSSGYRRGYKGVERRTLLVWSYAIRNLEVGTHGPIEIR